MLKTKTKKDLRTQTAKELRSALLSSQKQLLKLKLDLKTNQLQDTSQLKKLRAKIAFIKSLLSALPAEAKKL